MKRPSWNTVIASVVIFSVFSSIENGQAYQYFNLTKKISASQSLVISESTYSLVKSEDSEKLDLSDSEMNKANSEEQQLVDKALYLIWKIFLIIGLLALSLIVLVIAVGFYTKRERTVILPFSDLTRELVPDDETYDDQKSTKENQNSKEKSKRGEAVVDILISELHNIRRKYEDLDNYISVKNQNPDGDSCVDASSLRKKILIGSPIFPHLNLGDSNVVGNIGEVTTSGPIAAKISLDSIVLLFKWISPFNRKNRTITGSIQKCNNCFRIIARMEQGRNTRSWEVNSESKDENLPNLVKSLAFSIARDLSKQQVSYNNFKKLIDLLDCYSSFASKESQEEENKLKELWEKCKTFARLEPAYEGLFGLLYNIGIVFLEKKEYDLAEDALRRAISLEPYIINKVFDAKVAYEDVNWSQNFWKESFRDYCLRNDFSNYFLYSLRSRIKKLSLSKEKRHEYYRISTWAKGLSYTLIALGQTLERVKADEKSLSKDSFVDHFVAVSQAREAYSRADQRDRKDATALAHLSSLMIENVRVLENHDQLKEGIIEEAQEILSRAVSSKLENRYLAFNRLGNLQHDQGDYKLAIESYKKAIADRHSFVVAYRTLGIVFCEIMDFDNSLRYFTEGMIYLPDEAIFQTTFCPNEWHAWLHNGKGWTYLSKYISLSIDEREKGEASLLDLAEYNFHEAIGISNGKMYSSYFNLGYVYALSRKVNKAKESWKKGLQAIQAYKHTYLGEILSYIYSTQVHKDAFLQEMLNPIFRFAESKHLIKENTEKLKEYIRANHPPIRILNAILQDLLIVKEFSNFTQPNYVDVDDTIQFLEDYLPTLYVGISYIWKRQIDKAINVFHRKLPELYLESKEPSYKWFRSYLWILLYCGLIHIFDEENKVVTRSIHTDFRTQLNGEETLKMAIQRFNDTATYWSLSRLDPDKICNYSLEDLRDLIQEVFKQFDKIIQHHSSSKELYREILNDMHRKFEILRRGVGSFDGDDYRKKLTLIFQPVEDSYRAFEHLKMNSSRP